jgi:LmbE family N-acetylglucosaminyl deacetylase
VVTDRLDPFPTDWQRALAVVAHPDDLEYGAGAAVAAWTRAGKDVAYLLVTRGEAGIDGIPPGESASIREVEQRRSAEIVGVSGVEFLDHPDGVIEYGIALRRDIAEAIRRHRPELVVTGNFHDTWGDGSWNSPDHRAVGRATLDAVTDAGNRWIFPDLTDQEFTEQGLTPWSGVRYVAVAGSPYLTHAVDITDTLAVGVEALRAHRRYLEGLGQDPMAEPPRLLEGMAAALAPRFGGRLATGFQLYVF